MDIIQINQLQLSTTIGIHAWEQKIKRRIILDLELGTDTIAAASSDDISNTIDYEALTQRLEQYASENSFQLLESLANKIADLILNEFGVLWLRVKACKPHATKNIKSAAVTIERKP